MNDLERPLIPHYLLFGAYWLMEKGDMLIFYCGLEGWDHRSEPALYLMGYFEVLAAEHDLDKLNYVTIQRSVKLRKGKYQRFSEETEQEILKKKPPQKTISPDS